MTHFLVKIVVFLLFMASLVILKEIFMFVKAFLKGDEYETTTLRRTLFAVSLSFIGTTIITGLI